MKILFSLALLIFLTSCSEQVDSTTPAQSHIDEYTSKLKSCQENKLKSDSAKHNSQESLKTLPPKVNSLFDIKESDMVYGNPYSKTTIIEYFSLTCPHCSTFHKKVFPGLKEKYIDNGKIAYVIRGFVASKQDYEGFILARCEGSKERFMQFITVLLEQQDKWAFNKSFHEHLVKIGNLGGISEDSFQKCLADEHIANLLISNAKEISKSPKFVGTPTFYINGEQYNGAYSLEDLSNFIENSLKK